LHCYDGVFPRLAGNPIVQAIDPKSLISIVLAGSQTPRTTRIPAQFSMSSFAWRLSDQGVTAAVNFIRMSWGNSAPPASFTESAKLRKALLPIQAFTGSPQ
jgi:alcohol dehydrogenase (quinone), cytochrome c subunit